MRLLLPLLAAAVGLFVFSQWSVQADAPVKADPPKRVPWTTSRIKGTPEPPPPYKTEPAFPKLKFYEPLEMVAAPGTDRLFVAERPGKIFSFPNRQDVEKADLFIDLKKTVYGLVFHPDYAKNGYVYITYVLDASKAEPKGTRVARFTRKKDQPLELDSKSEKLILEWPSGGHNGGCLRFGPDGYLYIATGDGSGIADEFKTGQDLSDLLGAILRIDVNVPDDGPPYGIPKNNPFINTKGARPENYAYGLRQVWKFSFDSARNLWAGEVGQDLWEMVYRIERGGNYGWSVTEGAYPFRPERPKGPTPILKPVVEHPHSDFRSITGGYVYHGQRLEELVGAYIYGDYDSGKVWAFRHRNGMVRDHHELVDSTLRIVAFGLAQDGEIYMVDFIGGGLHRLALNPAPVAKNEFPRKLSETGLFSSTKDLKPAPGLIPYSVNSQLWSDGASKERYLAIPNLGRIQFNAIEYPQPSPGAPRGWRFPDGTVAVKTFFLEMEAGNPASRRRLETRILHFEQLAGTEEVGDQFWRGYTYVWNDEQTDAFLLDAKGLDKTYTIKDKKTPKGERLQTHRFPSRTECVMCHTVPAKYVLGLNTLQLNRDHAYDGVVRNQLQHWEELGMFEKPLPEPPAKLPRLADPDNAKESVDARARSYLHANCAHCHMKWGGGNAEFLLLATIPVKDMGIVNVRPNHGTFDIMGASVLTPGKPEQSLLYDRMKRTGLGRMPHIASNEVDEKGAALVREWIGGMK